MDTTHRKSPRSPAAVTPPLVDNGFLAHHTCGEPERIKAALLLAGERNTNASDIRIISEILGISEEDLATAKEFLRKKRAQTQVQAAE